MVKTLKQGRVAEIRLLPQSSLSPKAIVRTSAAARIPWGRPGTGGERILRYFPPMPAKSSFVCSILRAGANWSAWRCRNAAKTCGMVI